MKKRSAIMKTAIVCDWLVTYAGAERVLEQMIRAFPEADLFSVVDFVPSQDRAFLQGKTPKVSFLQQWPQAAKRYRSYLPFMPLAIEQLDLSGYDLILSSSHAVAKGILTGPDQVHISYVHSPIRYAWDLQHQYLREAGLTRGMKGWLAKAILHYMRLWDSRTASGVDAFLANSHFIARRIKKVYGREASVIYPPVDVERFVFCDQKEDYYVTASRMVPYKRIDLIVEAFSAMPDKKLVVIGDGPDFAKIKARAGRNIELLGYQPTEVMLHHMQHARAFVFAAEEDFGIAPVEAQACGTPVIAYGKGGALETVRGGKTPDGRTGCFFYEQTVAGLCAAVNQFETEEGAINYQDCRENALRFSIEAFRTQYKEFVMSFYKEKRL